MTISGIQVSAHPYKMWVPLEMIVALRSQRNYTEVILTDGRTLLLAQTLKTVNERIDYCPQFFRVNRSCLLNLQHIVKCEPMGNGLLVHLVNGETQNVSRRRKMEFLDRKANLYKNILP